MRYAFFAVLSFVWKLVLMICFAAGRNINNGVGSFKEIYGELCRYDHWSSASKCVNILKAGVYYTPLQNKYSKNTWGDLFWELFH